MWPGRHNYHLNAATVLRDLYRLVTMAAADRVLLEEAVERDDALRSLRNQFLEDELVHLLIGTAIANRTQLDHMSGPRNDPDELSYEAFEHDCGTLQPDASKDEHIPLSFREACNKIVHAMQIVAETEGDPNEYPIGRFIVLRGHRRSEAWIANLDLIEYARASVRNFEDGL